MQDDGSVVVLDADGREIDRFSISMRSPRGALLQKDTLFVLGADAIEMYDMRTHARLQTQPLQLGVSGYARLVGAHNGVLVYIAGIAMHMARLSSGRDVTLNIKRQGVQLSLH